VDTPVYVQVLLVNCQTNMSFAIRTAKITLVDSDQMTKCTLSYRAY